MKCYCYLRNVKKKKWETHPSKKNTEKTFDFEHTLNDYWNEEKKETLSVEWNGTTRFQIVRTKFPEGYNWVNGKRPHGLARRMAQFGKETTVDCKKFVRKEDSSRFRPKTHHLKVTSDAREKTLNMCGSSSTGVYAGEPSVLSIFKRTGKQDATIISKSREGKPHQNMLTPDPKE